MSSKDYLYNKNRARYREILRSFKRSTNEVSMIARWITSNWKKRKKYRLLDIGAGDGTILKMLESSALAVSAIEPDPNFAKRLRVATFNVCEKRWENCHPAGQYDVIIVSHVFYYFPRPSWKKQISKMVQLLARGGKLFIVVNSPRTGFMDLLSLATRRGLSHQPIRPDFAILKEVTKTLKLKTSVEQIPCRVMVPSWKRFFALCQFHLELTPGSLEKLEKELRQYYATLKTYKGKKVINYTLTGFCVSRTNSI